MMALPYQKLLCPKCAKMTLYIWPAAGDKPSRKSCANPGCGYKE